MLLQVNSALTYLNLGDNAIGGAGARCLGEALKVDHMGRPVGLLRRIRTPPSPLRVWCAWVWCAVGVWCWCVGGVALVMGQCVAVRGVVLAMCGQHRTPTAT